MLPYFQTSNKDLSLLQTGWSSQLNPLLAQPIANGQVLKDVSLTIGSNTINHKLGRKLQGWWIVRQRASGSVYDTQDVNTSPQLTLLLTSTANMVVDILVF